MTTCFEALTCKKRGSENGTLLISTHKDDEIFHSLSCSHREIGRPQLFEFSNENTRTATLMFKPKRFMKKFILSFFVLLSVSCAMESEVVTGIEVPETDGSEKVDSGITLTIPGGFSIAGTTRALSETQEAKVGEAYVLLFDADDLLVDVAGVSDISNVNGAATFKVKLKRGDHKVVVIANADQIVEDAGLKPNEDTYSDVAAKLIGTVSEKMFPDAEDVIPMWGETEGTINITASSEIKVRLLRSIARIDIGVGTWNDETKTWEGLSDFKMTGVYVISPSKKYSVMAGAVSTDKFTVDQSEEKFQYAGDAILRSIYVPEVAIAGTEYEERTALVVSGLYEDALNPSFYRVDFVSGPNLIDIQRNTLYRFEISSVKGAGYSTVEDAYAAASNNMEAEIIDWSEESMGDAHFYGNKSITLSDNPVKVGLMRGDKVIVDIATKDLTDFTITSPDELMTLSTSGNKKVDSPYYTYTLAGSGSMWSLTIEALDNNFAGAESLRTEVWNVNADDLIKFNFTVSQFWASSDPTLRKITIGDSSPVNGGTAVANHTRAAAGTPVSILASSEIGYEFDCWVVDPESITTPSGNPATFIMPDIEVSIRPVFRVSDIYGKFYINVSYDSAAGSAVSSAKTASEGQTASLMATAKNGWRFKDWSLISGTGASIGDSKTNPTTLTVGTDNIEVGANFTQLYNVSVSSNNNVMGSASSTVAMAAAGDVVSVAAIANVGYVFEKWTGVPFDDASANPATFTMSADQANITANFKKQTRPVSVVANNSSWGAPTFSPDDPKEGDTVTINPIACDGGIFVDYEVVSGNATISEDNSFKMPDDLVSIRVNYRALDREITVGKASPQTSGYANVTSDKGSNTSLLKTSPGGQIVVTAYPAPNYIFDGWSISGAALASMATNPSSFVMPENDVTVTPVFSRIFTPTVNGVPLVASGASVTGGKVIGSAVSAREGETIALFAVPDGGQRFTKWGITEGSGILSSTTANPTTLTVGSKVPVVTVTFSESAGFTASGVLKIEGAGAISINDDTASEDPTSLIIAGDSVTFAATANNGYAFAYWDITAGPAPYGYDGSINPTTFAMPSSDIELTAYYTRNKYKVTINNVLGLQSVNNLNDDSGTALTTGIEHGTTPLGYTIVPTEEYTATGWTSSIDIAYTEPAAGSIEFTMPIGDLALTPVLALRPKYTFTVAVAPAEAKNAPYSVTTSPAATSTAVLDGKNVDISASATSGINSSAAGTTARSYLFDRWSGLSTATTNSTSVTQPADDMSTVTANYIALYGVSSTTTTGEGVGNVTITSTSPVMPASGGVAPGTGVTITASTSGNSKLTGLIVNDGSTGDQIAAATDPFTSVTFDMPEANVTVSTTTTLAYTVSGGDEVTIKSKDGSSTVWSGTEPIDDGFADSSNAYYGSNQENWTNAQSACPMGWRLPTIDEFAALVTAATSTNWKTTYPYGLHIVIGNNTMFFAASGYGDGYYEEGKHVYYWTSSIDEATGEGRAFHASTTGVSVSERHDPGTSFSVRCVRSAQ